MSLTSESGDHAARHPTIEVDATRYLGLAGKPLRIASRLAITYTDRSFVPLPDELAADWVATVAVPAFKLIRQRQGVQQAFASIGTGVGLDALAAIETLGATRIGITDVHEEVVSTALTNITRNLRDPFGVALDAGAGDLLSPLRPVAPRYDLIYENLPNIQIDDAERIAAERTSSGHFSPRAEPVPDILQQNFLALHYLALQQAPDFLKPGGAVLSMLGGRVPLSLFQEMAALAGLKSEIYTYGWKIQAMPEEIIRGHADRQRDGYGPFHFYLAARLAEAFESVDLESSGARALEIEDSIAADRLDPFEAYEAWKRGEVIGHTFAVLRSWVG